MADKEALPIIYILHGDDDYKMEHIVQKLCAGVGSGDQASLNITHLDGKQASLEDISTAAATLSFFDSGRRLVILSNPLAKFNKDKKSQERFCSLMDSLPPTTCLVLLILDGKERGDWQLMPEKKKNWLREWLVKAKGRAKFEACLQPRLGDMPGLIVRQAKELKGEINPEAARLLASHTGSDTRMAFQEVNKLLTYVDFKREVEVKDVELLSVEGGPVSIFDMVDALGSGNHKTALHHLHSLLELEDASMLFSMIVRQFRLLLQVHEIRDGGGNAAQVQKEFGVPEFVGRKLIGQAERFSMQELETIYKRLCAIDVGVKTGEIAMEVALDDFAAGLRN
jgi:DNA polymerase III subunit delta